MSFLDHLVEHEYLSDSDRDDIRGALDDADTSLDEAVVERGVSTDDLLEAKAAYYNLPSRRVQEPDEIGEKVLQQIPEESAEYYQFVPLQVEGGTLEVGIVNPNNIDARDALNFIAHQTGKPYKLFVITKQDFDKVLEQYGSLSGEVTEALSELDTDEKQQKQQAQEGASTVGDIPENKTDEIADGEEIDESDTVAAGQGTIVEDTPITKIVATILRYATEGGASDIHIERMQQNIRVRFRVDGTLNTSLLLPTKVHSSVVARIKILSDMRLDEKRKPQDGRFSAKIEGRRIDFRVSTFPAYYGEKIVMRLLDQSEGVRTLEELELTERNDELLREAINASYGLVLISGPTGSGKTTTLYAMLDKIDKERNNVLSLEDPIEYNIEGISQSQVRPDIGYTFANGLRTTLRQDPDVIMVGEIRDAETAQLAIHAALTGHLVFSTIHTNNAIGIIPRLVDMGIDPYLIAPTLIAGVAQRLVSRLCEGAGEPKEVEGSVKAMIEDQFSDLPEEHRDQIPDSEHVYEAGSTSDCPTGTKGRMAVMEVVRMSDAVEQAILNDPTENAIYEAARKEQGMLTMKEDAIIKALDGKIPFSEINAL